MSYQVLARKWRPKFFKDMIGQEHVLQALTNALTRGRLHHAYLFTGTRGVGKTTLARILAKCLNCELGVRAEPCGQCGACVAIDEGRYLDLIEVDAASRTKVEDTRSLLENVDYAPSRGRFKIYLIDEVHMLSAHSFNALLKTLEEPPSHVKFLLATTDPQKLPITVLSRCLQFHLRHLSAEQITQQLSFVLTAENIPFEIEAIKELAQAAAGSVRDALSLTDQAIALGDHRVNLPEVRQMLGTIDRQQVLTILFALASGDAKEVVKASRAVSQYTIDFNYLLSELMFWLHQITLLQLLEDPVGIDITMTENLRELSTKISPEDVQLMYQIALHGQRDLPLMPDANLGFEMILLRMLLFVPATDKAPDLANRHSEKPLTKSAKYSATPETSEKNITEKVPDATQQASITNQRWIALFPKLKLNGLAETLAANCEMKIWDANEIVLHLARDHQMLLTDKASQRITEQMQKILGKSLAVKIEVVDKVATTPLIIAAATKRREQDSAIQELQKDKTVQQLMQTFNAEIIRDSIVISQQHSEKKVR